MKVQLATPEKIIFEGESDDILVEAENGQLNILDRHTDLVSFIRPGTLVLRSGTQETRFEVGEGVLKVEKDRLSILSPEAKMIA